MNKKPVLPPREKSKPIVFARRTAAQNLLWADYARLFTWRAVGAEYGVSVGAVYRLAVLGKEPRDNAIRARLGLPALASAPICVKCGMVHYKICHSVPEWVIQTADWLAARQKAPGIEK